VLTFVLKPADGEQVFEENAWSNGGCYNITGSSSKSKDNVMHIKHQVQELNFGLTFLLTAGSIRTGKSASPAADVTWDNSMTIPSNNEFGRYPTIYHSIKE
jgi:hypothetical protein